VLTVLAAALRVYGIGHQGLWFDEAFTVTLVKLPFGTMLSTVPKTESTPYLYYILAWGWTHLFGDGAVGIRSLSALSGTALVPVSYLAAVKLSANRRAALIVAALTTFNPLLIWYSQEARAYELLALTGACTLLAFAYVCERRTPRRLCGWAVLSGLALATHYDAALVVGPQALWLLIRHRRELGVWLSVAFVAACGGGLLPLLIAQDSTRNAVWIKRAPLNDRLGQILPQFLLGTGSHAYAALTWIGFALCAAGLAMAARGTANERTRALGMAGLALAGFALTMLVLATGSDTVITRNLLALWLPLALLIAVGLGSRRAGRLGVALAAGICAIGLTATVSIATDTPMQRPDWPGVVRTLGAWPSPQAPAGASRLVIFPANPWLKSLTSVYMSDTRELKRPTAVVPDIAEIDVVANRAPPAGRKHWLCWWGAGCNLYPSSLQGSYAIPGFREAGVMHVKQFSIMRLVAVARPRTVSRGELRRAMGVTRERHAGLLLQRSAAG
jgi:mannosyltransferase